MLSQYCTVQIVGFLCIDIKGRPFLYAMAFFFLSSFFLMKNETNVTRSQFVTDGEEMYEEDQHLRRILYDMYQLLNFMVDLY